MQFRALTAAVLAFAAFGSVSANTGPLGVVSYARVCGRPCGPIVTQSQNYCIKDDLKCICDQPHMKQLIPICDACSKNQKNAKEGIDFYPQIQKLLKACDLKSTSVTLGAAAPTAMPLLGAGAAAAAVVVMGAM